MTTPPEEPRTDGPMVPGYTDLVRIGRGGFSVVYSAVHERLGRPVALKVLMTDLVDPRDIRRFEAECRALGSLGEHPNIVDVFDAGVAPDGRPFIAMRLYRHGTLADRVTASGPIPAVEVVDIGIQIADALAAAHATGVIHRDIKPENLLIGDDSRPVVTDFGVAALADEAGRYTTSIAFTSSHVSPEVLDRNEYGVASDIYALASTLYSLISGRAVFEETSEAKRIVAVMTAEPEAPPAYLCPPALSDVLLRCLRKEPSERFATAAELRDALGGLEAAPIITASPVVVEPPAVATPLVMPAPTPTTLRPPAAVPVAITTADVGEEIAMNQTRVSRRRDYDPTTNRPADTAPGSRRRDTKSAVGRRWKVVAVLAVVLVAVVAGAIVHRNAARDARELRKTRIDLASATTMLKADGKPIVTRVIGDIADWTAAGPGDADAPNYVASDDPASPAFDSSSSSDDTGFEGFPPACKAAITSNEFDNLLTNADGAAASFRMQSGGHLGYGDIEFYRLSGPNRATVGGAPQALSAAVDACGSGQWVTQPASDGDPPTRTRFDRLDWAKGTALQIRVEASVDGQYVPATVGIVAAGDAQSMLCELDSDSGNAKPTAANAMSTIAYDGWPSVCQELLNRASGP